MPHHTVTALPTITQFAPEITMVAATLVIFLLDIAGVKSRAVLGGITTLFSLVAFSGVLGDLGAWPFAAMDTLPSSMLGVASGPIAFTSLGLIFQGIFLGAVIIVSLASISEPEEEGASTFYALLALAAVGMLTVAISADLILLLLAIEITGISTYVLVGYTRKDSRALEAAMKFYIIGALSTAISFFGASLIYGAYGTTSLSALGGPLPQDHALALVGFAMLAAGLGFKATLVPFHMWAVDVYDGAPAVVSSLLSAGSKKMGLFAIFAVFVASMRLFAANEGYALYFALGSLAVLTMTVGNVMALEQQTMRRMLAYSSISQAGYMLLGIAIDTPPALAGSTLQIAADVLMKGGAFVVVAAVTTMGIGPLITDYKGLGHTRPGLASSFAIMLLSLAGMPLTLGFVGKFYLFFAAVEAGGFFTILAIAGLLNSALSVFYYARVLKIMYMSDDSGVSEPERLDIAHSTLGSVNGPGKLNVTSIRQEIVSCGAARWFVIVAVSVLLLVLGIYPTPLVSAMNGAAQQFWTIGF